MNRIKKLFLAFGLTLVFFTLRASSPIVMPSDSALPRVFVLGQYDGIPFERMKKDYEATLMTACKNDMETAYYCWLHLLKNLESFATKSNYDINGVKLWLYAFWEKDGTIGYLSYYPKPNSKNFKAEEMNAFLNEFRKTYVSPLKYEKAYSNYSNASFPVMVEKTAGMGEVGTKGPTNTPAARVSGQKK
jgi:hypothetical protein